MPLSAVPTVPGVVLDVVHGVGGRMIVVPVGRGVVFHLSEDKTEDMVAGGRTAVMFDRAAARQLIESIKDALGPDLDIDLSQSA
jgi:hypothetical protein